MKVNRRRNILWCAGGLLLVQLNLSGCAEMADIMLADVNKCHGCDWIIQEWDNPGWSTHNSKPYKTEAICEQELFVQSTNNHGRGYRCIYEGDLIDMRDDPTPKRSPHCSGCDWAVEYSEYGRWERAEKDTHSSEGACQQWLWQFYKKNPQYGYRCRNLDM